MNPIFYILILLPAAAFCADCVGKPDGSYEIGCRSYAQCLNGVSTIIDCDEFYVYSNKTGGCDYYTNVAPPCGVWKDCSGLADGRYPDRFNGCKSYYTCFRETFYGHNLCPGKLVFNAKLQICDWSAESGSPCATLNG